MRSPPLLEALFQGDALVPLLDGDPLHRVGVAAALLSIVAFLPYARDILAGRTRPQRASWLIWSVLSCIAFGSQVAEGAGASLWFSMIQCGGTVGIFLLTISRGTGRFLSTADGYVLAAAAVGLGVWAVTEVAVYALAGTITISLLGGAVTIKKAYLNPGSETLSTWIICFVASGLALISVGRLDWALLAYPLYLFTLYGAILIAIALGRTRRSYFGLASTPM